MSGLAFGNTSTVGRIIIYPTPAWKIIYDPLLYSLIISALLGQYLFTLALQRISATKSNTAMISMQTLGPALIGLLLLNDRIKTGYLPMVIIGSAMVISGTIRLAIREPARTTL